MFTSDEAQQLAQKVVKLSTFPECQVTVTASEQAYTRFANNGITTAALGLRQNVTIAVTRDSRTGVYSVDELDDASLRKAVVKAEELAAISPANPEHLPPLGAQEYKQTAQFRRGHRQGTGAGDDPTCEDDHRRGGETEPGRLRAD